HIELDEICVNELEEEDLDEAEIQLSFSTRGTSTARVSLSGAHRIASGLEYNIARRNKNALKFLRYRSITLLCTMVYVSLMVIAVFPYCHKTDHKIMAFSSAFFGLLLSSIFQVYFCCAERIDVREFNLASNN
ncbi:hypothetical protein, partial [Candidatus Ichthyocystis hellenicum]|uniref:hypothetical protein n=1 Tax=Candidatus Ichthyocystis hellenicum TaxID=1561003 RepID=UPI001584F6CE